jgi:hypothetical protein
MRSKKLDDLVERERRRAVLVEEDGLRAERVTTRPVKALAKSSKTTTLRSLAIVTPASRGGGVCVDLCHVPT